jgi:hypothetical protein
VVSIVIRNEVIHYFTHSNNYSLLSTLVSLSSHVQKGNEVRQNILIHSRGGFLNRKVSEEILTIRYKN